MSTALRAITRLQDADDFGVTVCADDDGKALVYDHTTGMFVLRAMASSVEVEALSELSSLVFLFDDGDIDNGDVQFVIG
jgi:hypothetical protein